MNLAELRKLPHLSASSIGTYIDCSMKYKLAKIDKLPPSHISDSLVYGSTIHRVLEVFHEARMYNERVPLSMILELFEDYWKLELNRTSSVKFKKGVTAESLLNQGKSLLTVYCDKYPYDDYKVIGTEEAISFTIPGLPVPIIGAIDLLEEDDSETLIITDHKTAGRAFSNAEVLKNMQLTIYQIAMKKRYPGREILLKLDALIKTKKPRFEQFYTYRDEVAEQRVIKKILAVWDGIQKEVFIPNEESMFCGNCEQKLNCNNWFAGRRAA